MSNGKYFERLAKGRPAPEPAREPTPLAAGRLLEWLQKWPQPTICAKTIYQYGPRPNRDKESVLKLTAILEQGR